MIIVYPLVVCYGGMCVKEVSTVMIEDAYVRMLIYEREKTGISSRALCEGVYKEDMFYLVERGKRSMDRVTAKRLLARLGVDNGNYEHYLDAPDYEVWKKRMSIISKIDDGKIEEAQTLLTEYSIDRINDKDISRGNIEKQFCLFMQAQILKNKVDGDYKEIIAQLYEHAVKLTVPNIDRTKLTKLVLSPLETILVLERKRYNDYNQGFDGVIAMYREFIEYVENASYSKASAAKVYPKIVICMYQDLKDKLANRLDYSEESIYLELLAYTDKAKKLLNERDLLYYMVEILEIQVELVEKLHEYHEEKGKVAEQLKVLKDLYAEYEEEPYMKSDGYLYRESGIYCANDVIKIRRDMCELTQEELCRDDISFGTLRRIENARKAMKKETLRVLFDRLKLYPSCVNMGVVTDKKEVLDKYEEIRFVATAFKNEELKQLIAELKELLSEHPKNNQIIIRLENQNKWRLKELTDEEYVNKLKEALECTIELKAIQEAEHIFLTTEELVTLYLVSAVYKESGQCEEAWYYIKEILKYCKDIECEGMETGRMGIYELIMEYVASLLGDMGKYEESNNTSHKLIKISLNQRRGTQIHPSLYNIAWNGKQSNMDKDMYNNMVQRCIILCQLMDDEYDKTFYIENLL